MVSKKVGLLFTEDYKKYNFGPDHPLRPLRLLLTYSLFEKLGLLEHDRLEVITPRQCTKEEIEMAHSPEYVEAVKKLSDNPDDRTVTPYLFGLGPGDNPIFKGMYEASSLVCGASLIAAEKVWNDDNFNIVFNPAGGLHHAMEKRASGFCIFNDIAVAIKHLQNIKKDVRIAYLDIDCHHGDGVQWLFYDDPNVLTISFHQSGRSLFPGTGEIQERGKGEGKGYSINFPLLPHTTNKLYLNLFRKCVPRILEAYQPDILVSQLGVDTHYDDPLTMMGLSIQIYRDLAQTIKTCAREYCQDKWLALGGGGYLMSVVPRAWSVFLAKMLEIDLDNELPDSWIEEVRKKVPNEDIPYLLWDHDDKAEVRLLSHQDYAKEMVDYMKELITICDEEYIPKIKQY